MDKNNTFNVLEKYVDEHMDEILDILRKEYLNKISNIIDVLVGDAVTPLVYEFPTPICIDKDKHLWYNTFNKWSWAKFENGVIKYGCNKKL